MNVDFSHELGSWFYRCDFGCFATDFESTWEAQRALEAHDCGFAQFPAEVRPVKQVES